VTQLDLGFPDAGNNRADTTTRQAYDLMTRAFGAGANGPLLLVARLEDRPAASALPAVAERVRSVPGVAAVGDARLNAAGTTAVLAVTPTTSPPDPRNDEMVSRLRDDVLPAATRAGALDVLVGGTTAATRDQSAYLAGKLPVFIGGVVGLSFLLLLAAFRAPLVAMKAAAMNLLSIGAAYGVISLVADGG